MKREVISDCDVNFSQLVTSHTIQYRIFQKI